MIINGTEGLTHINIYSRSQLSLGRWLSNFAYSPIVTEDGNFNSIEGYWYWLGVLEGAEGRDRLRKLHGYSAKEFGRKIRSANLCMIPEEEFKRKILAAIDLKLKSDLNNLKLLAESELPFSHYYEYKGKRVDAGFGWLVDHFTQRRTLLKEKWLK
jgi:hypothetical protein